MIGQQAPDSFSARWIHMGGSSSADLHAWERKFKIPFKALSGSMHNPSLLRRLKEVKDKEVLVIKFPVTLSKDQYHSQRLYVFIGKKEILTYSANEHGLKWKDWEEAEWKKILQNGPTFILFTLIEGILSEYFSIIEDLDESCNRLEEEVLLHQTHELVQSIFRLKKSITVLHRSLNHNRNIVLSLEDGLIKNINKKYTPHFRNQYNDFMELIDLIGAYRDGLSGTLELYSSTVSNNLNVIMKRMTALGSLVLVPTLIAGIYGMNFKYLPEFNWPLGYVWALGLMFFSGVFLMWYFKRRGYF